MFVMLANNIPRNKYQVKLHTFTTQIDELDNVIKIEELLISGGTCFNNVAIHVSSQERYPDNIIVISDGQCDFNKELVPERYAQRWSWIIDGSESYVEKKSIELSGKVFRLDTLRNI
jgi:hypothetical protein